MRSQDNEVIYQEVEEPEHNNDPAPYLTQVQAVSPVRPREQTQQVEQLFERPFTRSRGQAPELSSSW